MFKKFSKWHSRLTERLQTFFVVGDVPHGWEASLIQKDPEKGNATNDYCPIAYLSLI